MGKSIYKVLSFVLILISMNAHGMEEDTPPPGQGVFSIKNPTFPKKERTAVPAGMTEWGGERSSKRVPSLMRSMSRRFTGGDSPPRKKLSKRSLIREEILGSVSDFMRFLRGPGAAFVGRELHPDTRRSIFIFGDREIRNKKSCGRRTFENAYIIAGMAGGTGITWNVYGRNVLVPYGLLVGGFADYDSTVSTGMWTLMIALNVHTYGTLYPFNGGQMAEDAHDITSQWRYVRPYDWGPEVTDCMSSVGKALYHAVPRAWHSLAEIFGRPSMPYTPHSLEYAMPLAWMYWTLGTIPEFSAVVPILIESGNFWTGAGVIPAMFQRIGAQKRRNKDALEKFYEKLAEWGDDETSKPQRHELKDALENAAKRIRQYKVSRGDARDNIETLYFALFGRGLATEPDRKEKRTTSPSLAGIRNPHALAIEMAQRERLSSLAAASASPPAASKEEADIEEDTEDQVDEVLTDEGILATLYGFGGTRESDRTGEGYSQPTERIATQAVSGLVGVWGSLTGTIITDVAVTTALQFFGAPPEAAFIGAKFISVPMGIVKAGSSAMTAREYGLRVFDSFTGHRHYAESGEFNPFFTDVVFGKHEGWSLVVNYIEGIYWDGFLYGALGALAFEQIGIPMPQGLALIIPTIFSQGAFAAAEQADDIETAAHALQRLRVTKGCTSCCDTFLDTVFCCFRGRRRCTEREHLKGASRKTLKRSIHAFKILKAIGAERNAVRKAPRHVIADKHALFIDQNPFLGEMGDVETGRLEGSPSLIALSPRRAPPPPRRPIAPARGETKDGDALLEMREGTPVSPTSGASAAAATTGKDRKASPSRVRRSRRDGSIAPLGAAVLRLSSPLEDVLRKNREDEEEIVVAWSSPFDCFRRIFSWCWPLR
jgi:hypothetical protein